MSISTTIRRLKFSKNYLHVYKSYVSTSSSLVTVFNSRSGHRLNFNFSKNVGLFGLDELKSFDGFYLLRENAQLQADTLVNEACNSNRKRKLVDIFDELSDTLCRVADLAEFVRLAHPEAKCSGAAEQTCLAVSSLVEKLNTNKELYLALREVCLNGDLVQTSEEEQAVAHLFLFDFEQCGIHLAEKDRARVVALNNYILQVGQRFMAGCLRGRAVPAASLPSHLIPHLTVEDGVVVIHGLNGESENEFVREASYRIFLSCEDNQHHLLTELLSSRHELATLCGFPSYSHRVLKSCLAENPTTVDLFLQELNTLLWSRTEKDFRSLLSLKNKLQPNSQKVEPWDVGFLNSRYKQLQSDVSRSEVSAYFSLGSCMDGLSQLLTDLYGVALVSEDPASGELWAPDVYKLAVIHESEGLLGHIYCDFYERSGKPNHDCHFTIRCGRLLPDGSYQNPIVVVMLNLRSPSWGSPCLLGLGALENLFHEMGHAIHSMLGRTKHQHVSGTRTPTDFAEVPSILMEYFATDPRILERFGRHYQSGEQVPRTLLERACRSRRLLSASETHLQVFYSALDQEFHRGPPLDLSALVSQTQDKFYPLPHVPNTAWHLRFSHLVGYGAKYYSYLLSRAVASWLWRELFVKDPVSRSAGEAYRYGLLAHGGSRPLKPLLEKLLHKRVTPSTLAHTLIDDLDSIG